MDESILRIVTNTKDAVATNRGVYYQYLCVLKKWIENFISNTHTDIYTEVDDDIKEIGERLIFSQIKCYSSSFSLPPMDLSPI